METQFKQKPRKFKVGKSRDIEILDYGKLELSPNEMITMVTESGANYDITRKQWGYYATPSINKRLMNEGFKTALASDESGSLFIMIVEKSGLEEFEKYCREEKLTRLDWLDEYLQTDNE